MAVAFLGHHMKGMGTCPATGHLVFGLLVATCLVFEGCGDGREQGILLTQAQESHRQMLEVLEAVRVRSADVHPYLGQRKARRLRDQLAALPADEPAKISSLHFRLGIAELFLGNERQAIDHLDRAYQLFLEAGGPERVASELRFRLGLAWLRLGETQNCVLNHSVDSCILPIRGGGVHAFQEGSRNALPHLQAVLDHTAPGEAGHLSARWLLNIAHMTLGQYPDEVPSSHLIPPDAFEAPAAFSRFVNIAPALGLDTFSLSGGAVADDFDRDGYLDLMVSTWDTEGQLRFFHNEGNGAFVEHTEAANLEGLFGGLNLVQADYDNDGHLDLLVLRGAWAGVDGRHPNSLLHNQGDGTFVDVAPQLKVVGPKDSFPTWFWDFDNDGILDLFVSAYAATVAHIAASHLSLATVPVELARLYRGDGHGGFEDVTQACDLDLFEQMGGAYRGDAFADALYENPGFGNHWLAVEVMGTSSNRSGLGIRLQVDVAAGFQEHSLYRWVGSGGSFGGNPLRQFWGLGRAEGVVRLVIYWPASDREQVFEDVPMDAIIRVTEGKDE